MSQSLPADSGIGQLRAMRQLFGYGARQELPLMIAATALAAIASLPAILMIFLIGLLADGLGRSDSTAIITASAALGPSVALGWVLTVISERTARRFRVAMTVVFETRIAELQSQIPTLEHQERPAILDRLAVLRNETYVLDHMYATALSTVTVIARILTVLGLLVAVTPMSLVMLLALIPALVGSLRRPVRERRIEEGAAPTKRLADHLHRVLTNAEGAMELRVLGVGPALRGMRRAEWDRWHRAVARGRNATAAMTTAAWSVFFIAMTAVIVFASASNLTPGGAVILLIAGQQLGGHVATLLSEVGYIRGTWMEGAQRMAWLESYADRMSQRPDTRLPTSADAGIRAQNLTFTYPGSTSPALESVNLDIPEGTVVAIVGENGAGKSTLVKLIAGFYTPDSGDLQVGGLAVDRIDVVGWRERLSGCFQDFSRFEMPVRESVGVGDLPAADDAERVQAAARKAGLDSVLAKLPNGLDTQLGRQWPGGVGLSGGEWQKVALARCYMRGAPSVRFLDEPTSALDAETEHEIFARYADQTAGSSAVTILVSHRFSTVSMADLIIVLSGSRVVEQGSHADLMAKGGHYAELYTTQARAYTER